MASETTIADVLTYLVGPDWASKTTILFWPPDVFAISAHLLQLSGAYLKVVEAWPPRIDWQDSIKNIGARWRKNLSIGAETPDIKNLWERAFSIPNLPLSKIKDHGIIWQALVELCVTADSACAGVGIADPKEGVSDDFGYETYTMLIESVGSDKSSTLCKEIHPSRLSVLPKIHTSQKGMTIRSLSHHLALCHEGDVRTTWCQALQIKKGELVSRFEHGLSILIVPFPWSMYPAQFRPIESNAHKLQNLDSDQFGFFNYIPTPITDEFIDDLKELCQMARDRVGRLDGVVFPEMALQPKEYERVRDALIGDISFLVCGIYNPAVTPGAAENYANLCTNVSGEDLDFRQDKHHRWFLDNNQICQYGLGATLDPTKKWWENIALKERIITFISLDAWLTFSVLICEDLARPDPVGNIIRAVGPNLVIALLQDGPQLASRWPARCATILADDPGCSVLTLTSSGMARISKPQAAVASEAEQPNVIALWKEKDGGTREIALPKGAQGIVLSLASRYEKEWTADGRHDDGAAATLKIAGVHALSLESDRREVISSSGRSRRGRTK